MRSESYVLLPAFYLMFSHMFIMSKKHTCYFFSSGHNISTHSTHSATLMENISSAPNWFLSYRKLRLARIHTESKQFGEVLTLLKSNGDYFATIPKARTAKTVRNILNIVASVPDSLDMQITLCKDVVEWCKLEKRTFLRQRIEAKVLLY